MHLRTIDCKTENGGTVVSPRTSDSGGPGSILARGRTPWKGFQWFSFPLQVNTGVVPVQIGHAVYLPYLSYAFIYHTPVRFTVAYILAVLQLFVVVVGRAKAGLNIATTFSR